MEERQWEAGWEVDEVKKTGPHFQMEYLAIQEQRVALIRSYNFWYVFGVAASLSSYWLLMFMALSVSSLPLIVAAGVIGTTIVWFAYHVVINIDRGVVALYPRIVFLELLLGYDFYRDYLRRRPRGGTERSFIEKCEQINAETTGELWREIYSQFNAKDFPGSRRLTAHFRLAAVLTTIMYWVIIGIIVLPQYFGHVG